ncbi:hypothetical protein B0H19DRAFT_1145141 [Mycena capillaripes]|nr:hypothetical protein B0H19DRAFT_1145141 [Mycena capillaripes]
MSLNLTFKSKDILNSHLHANHSNPYTTSSSGGILGRKTTTLKTSGFLSGSAGKINWRDKTFEIGGKTKKWRKIEGSAGWFTSGREWEWSGHTYTVKHSRHKWTVTNSHGEVARFTPYKSHLLRPSEYASLQISPEIHDEHQRAFIILVLLYSETKRQDKQAKTAKGAHHSHNQLQVGHIHHHHNNGLSPSFSPGVSLS